MFLTHLLRKCWRFSFLSAVRVAPLMLLQVYLTPMHAQQPPAEVNVSKFDSVHLSVGLSTPRMNLLPEIPDEGIRFANHRFEDLKRVRNAEHSRGFLILSAGVYAFAALDMYETKLDHIGSRGETDPFAKGLVLLPRPAYFASGFVLATGVNWIAWKMSHSRRWHNIWWLPQVATMAGNLQGYSHEKSQEWTRPTAVPARLAGGRRP